jgi:hypothetical protein
MRHRRVSKTKAIRSTEKSGRVCDLWQRRAEERDGGPRKPSRDSGGGRYTNRAISPGKWALRKVRTGNQLSPARRLLQRRKGNGLKRVGGIIHRGIVPSARSLPGTELCSLRGQWRRGATLTRLTVTRGHPTKTVAFGAGMLQTVVGV